MNTYVECPTHGIQEIQSLVRGEGSFTVRDSTSSCPECGKSAPVVSAQYESDGQTLKVTPTSFSSASQISRLAKFLRDRP